MMKMPIMISNGTIQAQSTPTRSARRRGTTAAIAPLTIADGVATANSYPMTLSALQAGLRDFVTVGEEAIVEATRLMISTTHNLAEPSGAVGLAGLMELRTVLADKTVCVILSGGNADTASIRRIFV